jgi:dephospho-CoA kinase
VIDCDLINRNLQKKGTKQYNSILEMFGKGVENFLDQDGEINRKVFASLIFSDPQSRAKLSKLMRMPIMFQIFKQILFHYLNGEKMVWKIIFYFIF